MNLFRCLFSVIILIKISTAQVIPYMSRNGIPSNVIASQPQNVIANVNNMRTAPNIGIVRNVPNVVSNMPNMQNLATNMQNIASNVPNMQNVAANMPNMQNVISNTPNVQVAGGGQIPINIIPNGVINMANSNAMNAQVANSQSARAQVANVINENVLAAAQEEAINKASNLSAAAALANLAGSLASINGNMATFNLGNAFTVTSGSPGNQGFGIHLLADALEVGGSVAVNGQIPIYGTVALNGNLPTDGRASVSYSCGKPACTADGV